MRIERTVANDFHISFVLKENCSREGGRGINNSFRVIFLAPFNTYGTSLVHLGGLESFCGKDSPGVLIMGCGVVVVVVYFVVWYSVCSVL